MKSERLNANGFNFTIVYETTAPLIIAHVNEVQELKDPRTQQLVRTVTLDYWEWFSPGLLPAGAVQPPNMPNNEWAAIAPLRGKTIVLSDALQSGPFLITGLGAYPDPFHVTITRTHTYYTGGTIAGQAAGINTLDLGTGGFLQTDANGGNPSFTKTEAGPPAATTDMTQDFRRNKTIQGQITNLGTQQGVLTVVYFGAWQTDPAAPPTFGVDWRTTVTVPGAAARTVTGSDGGKRPNTLP